MTPVTAPPAPVSSEPSHAPDVHTGTRRRWGTAWQWSLGGIALVAVILTGWGVGGSMSEYYASVALSMSRSWPNFIFGSFDPAGTITLDKIPGSFWIPALSVRMFGFSPTAVILPNALAAAAAAVVTAITARRWAGRLAGVAAGAVVATTPILIAVARSNQPETFFVLALALTAWAATHALRRSSLGWLLLAGLFIAAAFQSYMLEAWAVWPALAAAYLCTRQSWWRRLWHVAVAGTVSLTLSLVWIVAVALVPASDRPYIGSTLTNSPWEMVFGYNGLGRFGSTTDSGAYRSFTPLFSGDPSAVRLLNAALADQIGWLIPTAVLAVVVLALLRFETPLLVFGATWLVTFAAMFSVVAGMHQFYTASMSVPMALLIGTAFARARQRRALWAQIALPTLAATTALAISIAVADGGNTGFSLPVAAVQALIAGSAVVLLAIERRRPDVMRLTALTGLVATLLTPAVWSAVTMRSPDAINPTAAGVTSASGMPGLGALPRAGGMRGTPDVRAERGASHATTTAVAWLAEHQHGTSYLAATFGAQSAASLIIASDGGSFLPIGGFDEHDPAPTLEAFQRLVADGELRFVIAGRVGGFGGGFGGDGLGGTDSATSTAGQIRTWALANCREVTEAPLSGLYSCGG